MDDDNNLHIFQMTTRSIEPMKELVKKEVLVFWHYKVSPSMVEET
jgi:hypothetical protein